MIRGILIQFIAQLLHKRIYDSQLKKINLQAVETKRACGHGVMSSVRNFSTQEHVTFKYVCETVKSNEAETCRVNTARPGGMTTWPLPLRTRSISEQAPLPLAAKLIAEQISQPAVSAFN